MTDMSNPEDVLDMYYKRVNELEAAIDVVIDDCYYLHLKHTPGKNESYGVSAIKLYALRAVRRKK